MLSALLDKTGDHQRSTSSDDGSLGTTRAWTTQTSGFSCAVWPEGTREAKEFYGRDIVGDHVIATDSDIGVKPQDRILIDGIYYLVNGFQLFGNAAVSSETLYLIDASKRTS